jgi:hypothetical protein
VNGEVINLNGGCTAKDIVGSITKHVIQVSALIADQSVFESFIKENQVGRGLFQKL